MWIDLWKLWIGPILLCRSTLQSAPRATLSFGVRRSTFDVRCSVFDVRDVAALGCCGGVVVVGLKRSRFTRMART